MPEKETWRERLGKGPEPLIQLENIDGIRLQKRLFDDFSKKVNDVLRRDIEAAAECKKIAQTATAKLADLQKTIEIMEGRITAVEELLIEARCFEEKLGALGETVARFPLMLKGVARTMAYAAEQIAKDVDR